MCIGDPTLSGNNAWLFKNNFQCSSQSVKMILAAKDISDHSLDYFVTERYVKC